MFHLYYATLLLREHFPQRDRDLLVTVLLRHVLHDLLLIVAVQAAPVQQARNELLLWHVCVEAVGADLLVLLKAPLRIQ